MTSSGAEKHEPLTPEKNEELASYLALQDEFDAKVTPLSEYSLQELRDALRGSRAIRLGLNGCVGGAGSLVTERGRELARELEARETAKAGDTAGTDLSVPSGDPELL